MMKSRSIIAAMLCVALVTLLSLSCGDDDKSPTGPTETGLAGTWKLTTLTVIEADTTVFSSDELELGGFSIVVVLNSDSTYQHTEIDEGHTTVETGTWSVSGNTITLVPSKGDAYTVEYVLAGNTFTITVVEGPITYIQVFTRQ